MNTTILKVLKLLEDYKFIIISVAGDFVSANESLGDSLAVTPLGKRVAELYLDPYTANLLLQQFAEFAKKKSELPASKIPFSLLHIFTTSLELRPLLRVKAKEIDDVEAVVLESEQYLMSKIPDEYDLMYEEYLASVKTALFFHAWISETDEEVLLERFDVRPGETRAKLDIFEWLVTASMELCHFVKLEAIISDLSKLQVRMKYGAKEELLPLLKLRGIGRVRARMLFNKGYLTLGDLKKASLAALKEIVGATVAASILKQVGGSEIEEGSLKEFL